MERKSHRPRARKAQRHARQCGERVALDLYGGTRIEGTLLDESTDGSGIRVLLPADVQVKVRQTVRIVFRKRHRFAYVAHVQTTDNGQEFGLAMKEN